MDAFPCNLTSLFEQLGLPSTTEDIDSFIDKHSGLSPDMSLERAPFWTQSQSLFLKEARDDDAEWAPVVDQLDTMLHNQP
jgi:hypothetical protein